MSNLLESLKSLKEGFESATQDSSLLRDIKKYALSKGIHPAIVAGFVFYYANGEEGVSPEEWETEGNGPMDPGELILSEFWQDYAKEAGLSVEGLGEVEASEFSGIYTNSKNWKDAFDKWSSKFPRGASELGPGDWKDVEKLLSDWGFKIEERKEGRSIFATKKLESDLVIMRFMLQVEEMIPWIDVRVVGKKKGLGREFRNKLEDVAGQDLDMEFGEIFDYTSIRSEGLGDTVTWLKNVVSKKVELFGGKVWDFCKRAKEDELREGLMESMGSYSGADRVITKLRGKGLRESFVGKLRESDGGGYTDDIPALSKKGKEKITASAEKVCPEGWSVDFKDDLNGLSSEDKYSVWFVKGKEALHVTVVDGEPLAIGVFRSFSGNTDKADTYFHGRGSLEKALDFLKRGGLKESLTQKATA